jgi:drug/metabolite transporter (DMT)-like permease
MSPQVKSQMLGLALASSTAVGCIAYERLVKAFSLRVVIVVCLLFYIPLLVTMFLWEPGLAWKELREAFSSSRYAWSIFLYWVTFVTTPLWYMITRKQNVMVGSTYEVKYIIILGLMYVFLGSRPLSWNVVIGVVLALCSIWFISR